MYLRKWSPVKYLMYLWLAILVWMFSRCDSAATMHLAPPPYHSSGFQGTPGGHSSSISSSSSSISSSGRYVSDSRSTTTSVSSHTSAPAHRVEEGLSGGAIPPRLYTSSGAPSTASSPPPPLPLLVLPRSAPWPWQQPAASRGSEASAVQLLRRTSANTKAEQPGRTLPANQLSELDPQPIALPASAGEESSTGNSSIINAERSLQQRWASQMRLKGERRRLHRRRWRTANNSSSRSSSLLASRNRRDSALLPTGYGGSVRPASTGSGQQHPVRPQRRNGTGGGPGQRRYCSARDPATLAFEAPIVCEAKVKSMSDRRPIFAATFEILALHKLPPKGRPLRGLTVRLQFNLTTANECDIFRGKFRERGFVREELELGKVYFLFLKPNMRYTNFTILGQPIRKTKRSEGGVLQGVNPNYGTRPAIHFITPNVTRVEGKRVRLVCKVGGQPPPKVAWFKDKRLINRNATKYAQVHLKKRSELIIFNTSTTDSGEYECRAKNRYNNSSVFNSTHVKITLPKATIPAVYSRSCADSHRDDFCHNGGTCFNIDSIGELACYCPKGFSGFRCENKDSEFHPVSSNKQQDCTSQRYAGYYC
ncbi:protein vein isoform X2 [Anopheles merus]|uniref:Protein vein n=1 Tax=Anopheles merus TaxID=30066 RepID=A0A2C9H5T1_ANOME|nr:protein vein isoform X2 [Anopheles merus]